MKITVYSYENGDGYICQHLYVDGKYQTSVHPLWECPEDAIIGRSLISCDDIAHYMKQISEAIERGETVEFERIEGCPDDE